MTGAGADIRERATTLVVPTSPATHSEVAIMGLSVDSAFSALASAFSLHETSPLDTDHAWVELKAAQQNMVEADAGGNFRQIDEALTRLTEAQDNFKQAVKDEGATSVLARHPRDADVQSAVSAAELSIAQDKLKQVEGKIPKLEDIPPQEEESRIQPPALYQELSAARRDVAVKTDALESDLDSQVLTLRNQGMSREDALARLRGQGYGYVIGNGSDKLVDGKMPTTLGMTEPERARMYTENFARNASPEARAAFDRGEPVVLAIRHDRMRSSRRPACSTGLEQLHLLRADGREQDAVSMIGTAYGRMF
jgi:hypothetical protein